MFENLGACFVMTYGILHVSHMDKCAHIFLYERESCSIHIENLSIHFPAELWNSTFINEFLN